MVDEKENRLKVKLKNFQAFSDLDIEFVQGVNIIMGQSNSGKTSVLRAIKTLVENSSRASRYIKLGEKEAEVTLEYCGNEVTWARTAKDIKYKINGEDFLKAGTTDLFKLLPVNGFVKDPQGELANLEDEWTLPYPYYKSPSELFKVFENIFCVSDSAKILKGMKESEDEYKRRVQQVEQEVDKLDKKVQAIQSLQVPETVEKLSSMKETLQKLQEEVSDYKSALTTLQSVKEKLKVYKNLPKDKVDLQSKLEVVSTLSKDFKKLQDLSIKYKVLSTLKGTGVTSQEMFSKLIEAKELSEDVKKLQGLEKVASIELPTTQVSISEEKLKLVQEYKEDLKKLKDFLTEGKRLKELIDVRTKDIDKCKEVLKEVDVCPLCGQEMKDCKELVKC